MKKSLIVTIAVACILALCFIGGCSSYNGMVSAQQSVDKQWGNVENAYQRRADLIPNLVNTVKGYAEHEKSTLQNVTDARAGLTQAYNDATASQADASPENVAAYQQAQEKLNSALNVYVNAVREAYPDLKANENFRDLQVQLEGTENRIATARGRYTEAVAGYNTAIKKFPTVIYAGWFGFSPQPQFKADDAAQRAPEVQF